MVFKRKLFDKLVGEIESREIIVLTGMRRVGKTTLYNQIFEKIKSKNKVFLDMENPAERKIFEEEDFNNIWANLAHFGIKKDERAYLVLDEIQSFPEIVKPIKYLFDHYKLKFFLTGSSSFYLKNLFPESLAGRKFVFELFPLDFEEYLGFKGKNRTFVHDWKKKDKNKNGVGYEKEIKLYDEYLEFGGFPGVVVAHTKEEKQQRLKDIFKSYFQIDVRGLADFGKINAFRDLILLLMQRVGSKLDITRLSKELGVSRETIYSYLSFLQDTYFISLVSPFSRNVDREVSGGNKVYFCDTGILNYFAKISEGAIFENAVFNNLFKYGKLNYYQRRVGAEIDFIVDEKIGIEVKNKGTDQDLRSLRKTCDNLGLEQGYLITKFFEKKAGFIPALEV